VRWLALAVGASGLAYLTRPEGLLLPAALVATLALSPRWVAHGLRGRRGMLATAVLVAGSAGLVGPYVALKGSLATKPSVARLLGSAQRSAADAVERQRPLEPGQSVAKTYALAAKATAKAVTEAVTMPLLPLALVGLLAVRPRGASARSWTLLAVIGLASALALVRLHATGGYCSPRHAMIPALVLIPAAASGLWHVASWLGRVAGDSRDRAARRLLAGAVAGLAVVFAPESLAPVNAGLNGYRDAGRWLSAHVAPGSRVVDVTGWSQYYSRLPGYTFENLVAAPADPEARWVVARESHLVGPWEYCHRLRALVDGLAPVEVFPGASGRRPTCVLVFDRRARLALRNDPTGKPVKR
jgi:hypothetical protein